MKIRELYDSKGNIIIKNPFSEALPDHFTPARYYFLLDVKATRGVSQKLLAHNPFKSTIQTKY